MLQSVQCPHGYRKVGCSNTELEKYFFFLHNEVRNGGWGTQHSVFHDVILAHVSGNWQFEFVKPHNLICTATVVEWIGHLPRNHAVMSSKSELGKICSSFWLCTIPC